MYLHQKREKNISFWAHIGKRTYFLVADCTDPILKGGRVSGFTKGKGTNGLWPTRVLAFAKCDGDQGTPYTVECISGTWGIFMTAQVAIIYYFKTEKPKNL